MYRGRLRTSAQRLNATVQAPAPFAGPLTVVDTSTLGPVATKDARGSWANLMSALTVRNICRHLSEAGFATDRKDVGAIVPYAGQRKLIQRMLADASLDTITAGTVHRYQGDEKRLVVLDLVDGIGRLLPGLWHQADQPTDEGAKLFNVAISRAKDHLVIVGDLAWLDRKLPAASLLRQWLHQMQDLGSVVDARSILAMWPMAEDLRRYGKTLAVDLQAARTGIFDEKDFLAVVQLDMARAKQGIAIWSAFVTPQGVARIADLLRARVRSGVKVRCVVRPPEQNGTIGEDAWAEGIRALQGVGVTIDIRTSMHEKVVLIDDDTAWLGSLNLLSHAGHTREVMLRVDGKQTALGVAAFLAADPKVTAERAAGITYEQENPDCEECGGRTRFVVAKNGGRFWSCQPCGWTRDARTGRERLRDGARRNEEAGPACPLCGKPTRKRGSRFGEFWGCTDYPRCNGTADG
jgi:ribosomal protein L37AE/L43A